MSWNPNGIVRPPRVFATKTYRVTQKEFDRDKRQNGYSYSAIRLASVPPGNSEFHPDGMTNDPILPGNPPGAGTLPNRNVDTSRSPLLVPSPPAPEKKSARINHSWLMRAGKPFFKQAIWSP